MAATIHARIENVVERHASEACGYAYETPAATGVRRCLLGWMATESGIRLPDAKYNTHVLGMEGTDEFVAEMQTAYGLSLDQLKQLQRANDESSSPAQLKSLVSDLLETWSYALVHSGLSER